MHNRDHYKSNQTVKYPDLSPALRPGPHTKGLFAPNTPEYLNFGDENSDSDDDHGQPEGGNVECDPTFEASCTSSEPHLLTQGDLNDLLHITNLSLKKQAEFLGSRLKSWNLIHHDIELFLQSPK
jgi:hypothetical protein